MIFLNGNGAIIMDNGARHRFAELARNGDRIWDLWKFGFAPSPIGVRLSDLTTSYQHPKTPSPPPLGFRIEGVAAAREVESVPGGAIAETPETADRVQAIGDDMEPIIDEVVADIEVDDLSHHHVSASGDTWREAHNPHRPALKRDRRFGQTRRPHRMARRRPETREIELTVAVGERLARGRHLPPVLFEGYVDNELTGPALVHGLAVQKSVLFLARGQRVLQGFPHLGQGSLFEIPVHGAMQALDKVGDESAAIRTRQE